MSFIERGDVFSPQEFSKIVDQERKRIISIKKRRRISTKTFSYLFENRDTVLNQINEMILVENVTNPEELDHLINTYNSLLPQENFLSISMFIEISNEKELLMEMPKLSGIERSVYLVMGDHEINAIPEEGRSTETLESTLQYLRIYFTREDAEILKKTRNAFLVTKHKIYSETAMIPEDLLKDLKSEIY